MKRFLLAVMLMVPVATVWADVHETEGTINHYMPCGEDTSVDIEWSGISDDSGHITNMVGEGVGNNTDDIYQYHAQMLYSYSGRAVHSTFIVQITSKSVNFKYGGVNTFANGKDRQNRIYNDCDVH